MHERIQMQYATRLRNTVEFGGAWRVHGTGGRSPSAGRGITLPNQPVFRNPSSRTALVMMGNENDSNTISQACGTRCSATPSVHNKRTPVHGHGESEQLESPRNRDGRSLPVRLTTPDAPAPEFAARATPTNADTHIITICSSGTSQNCRFNFKLCKAASANLAPVRLAQGHPDADQQQSDEKGDLREPPQVVDASAPGQAEHDERDHFDEDQGIIQPTCDPGIVPTRGVPGHGGSKMSTG
ncbi:hypothetical protein K466DRAFT_570458 [Polyporus arcularius HHB13444]|uniref:Uncharacterized protein n=1 Tax=Polyporus arcularius HHB13444 TaxID=1314778 RepID=A0A5C3NP96_9APHY|nr:hypothetical protein K466DRAFT_570458 [Polyporus arcularius HHB13444]